MTPIRYDVYIIAGYVIDFVASTCARRQARMYAYFYDRSDVRVKEVNESTGKSRMVSEGEYGGW